MFKKVALTLALFVLVGACVLGAGAAIDGSGLPRAITPESPCPATGCANGVCHGYEDVPAPDGVHEMVCPESSCASTECHAWETLTTGGYRSASDASLNLWVLFPAILVVGAIMLASLPRARKQRRVGSDDQGDGDSEDSTEGGGLR